MSFYFFGFNGFNQLVGESNPPDEEVKRLADCDRVVSVSLSWSKFCFIRDGLLIVKGLCKGTSSGLGSTVVNAVAPDSFVKVACSFRHVAVVLSSGVGKLFTIHDYGLEEVLTVPPGDHWKIVSCSVGDSDAAFINEDGRVIWVSLNSSVVESPILPVAWKVTSASCGKEHVLLVTETGTVYSFGQGSHGQLGHGFLEPEDGPRIVECLEGINIHTIAAGGWHSAAVSMEGDLYTWGWNESGQLGFETKNKTHQSETDVKDEDSATVIQAIPKCVSFPEEVFVTSVACGSRHTLVLTEEGRLWSCGWNGYNQLGRKAPDIITQPSEVQYFRVNQLQATEIHSGGWNSLVRAVPMTFS